VLPFRLPTRQALHFSMRAPFICGFTGMSLESAAWPIVVAKIIQ
jgi:hypothetical protein